MQAHCGILDSSTLIRLTLDSTTLIKLKWDSLTLIEIMVDILTLFIITPANLTVASFTLDTLAPVCLTLSFTLDTYTEQFNTEQLSTGFCCVPIYCACSGVSPAPSLSTSPSSYLTQHVCSVTLHGTALPRLRQCGPPH